MWLFKKQQRKRRAESYLTHFMPLISSILPENSCNWPFLHSLKTSMPLISSILSENIHATDLFYTPWKYPCHWSLIYSLKTSMPLISSILPENILATDLFYTPWKHQKSSGIKWVKKNLNVSDIFRVIKNVNEAQIWKYNLRDLSV